MSYRTLCPRSNAYIDAAYVALIPQPSCLRRKRVDKGKIGLDRLLQRTIIPGEFNRYECISLVEDHDKTLKGCKQFGKAALKAKI